MGHQATNRRRKLLAAGAIATVLLATAAWSLELSSSVVAGGGGDSAGADNVGLAATVGQAAAGRQLSGDRFSMQVGFWVPATGVLANISTRLQVGTGNNVLFAGFIVNGNASKTVLIRSAGPSLVPFGISNALANPRLELHDANGTIGTNDDWQTTQVGGVITSDQAAEIQATGSAPSDRQEPAIIATLAPGSYTAIVNGVGETQGIATVELYDLTPDNGASLANISTRGFIQTGNNVMIGGFIVAGQPLTVLIRATGPSLAGYGIDNALANPRLELHDRNGMLAGNDDWQTTQTGGVINADQRDQINNSGLAPTNPAESALIATLPPGLYTAIAQGADGGSGVGLIEVYTLP